MYEIRFTSSHTRIYHKQSVYHVLILMIIVLPADSIPQHIWDFEHKLYCTMTVMWHKATLIASLLYPLSTSTYFTHHFIVDKNQLCTSLLLNMGMLWIWCACHSLSHACPAQQSTLCAFQFKVTLFCFLPLVSHPSPPKYFPSTMFFSGWSMV